MRFFVRKKKTRARRKKKEKGSSSKKTHRMRDLYKQSMQRRNSLASLSILANENDQIETSIIKKIGQANLLITTC